MGKRATATFKIKAWEEKPYEDLAGGGKLTHASVITPLQGDIEGGNFVTGHEEPHTMALDYDFE